MSGILDQAKAAATSAVNTAGNLASQAATTTSNLATQAANSQTAADMTEGAKNLSAQAQAAMGGLAQQAGGLAGQAHQQAHTLAPGVIPAPAEGVDRSSDLEPEKAGDRAKFEKLFDNRATATDLKSKGILKGDPGDSLAGKRAELEKSMLEDKLDKEIASRPTADELIKKGILSRRRAQLTDKRTADEAPTK